MEVVPQIPARGPRGAAAGLYTPVLQDYLGGYGRNLFRKLAEVLQKTVDYRHVHEGVIVDHETKTPGGFFERQVVVLGKAAEGVVCD